MKTILEVIDNIKKIKKVDTDKKVAEVLGMTDKALSQHKNRSSVPYEIILKFCEKEGVSLDQLLASEGNKGKRKEKIRDRCVAEIIRKLQLIKEEDDVVSVLGHIKKLEIERREKDKIKQELWGLG